MAPLLLLLLPPLLLPPLPSPPAVPVVAMAAVVAETGSPFAASSEAADAVIATSSDADDAVATGAGGAVAAFGSGKGDATRPSTLPPPDAGAVGAVEAEKSAMLPIMYSDTTLGSMEDSGSRMTASSAECAKALSAVLALGFPMAVVVVLPIEEETPPMLFWPPEI